MIFLDSLVEKSSLSPLLWRHLWTIPYLIVVTGLESVVDADGEGDGQHGTEDDVVRDRERQRNHFEEFFRILYIS